MSNPKADARAAIVGALAGLSVPVHAYPPGAVGGACVMLTTATEGPRGHITVTLRCCVPDSSRLADLEQLEADARALIVADGHLGWNETTAQVADPNGYTYTEVQITTR